MRLLLGVVLLTFPVELYADNRVEWSNGKSTSYVEINPSKDSYCAAIVTFYDDYVHTGKESFTLVLDGLSVDFEMLFKGSIIGEDLRIIPPEGYEAIPETLQPGEEKEEVSYLCSKYVGS